MPRVKYTYDGSAGTETTENFSGAEETAQDAIDDANQAAAAISASNATYRQSSTPFGGPESTYGMEVI
jgi:hypothetical protein